MTAAYLIIGIGSGLVFGTFAAIATMLLQHKDLR